MIKKFNRFFANADSKDQYLHYYAFDWDDNILNMPTVIHMDKLVGDEWIPTDVSTADFAEVRNDKENWRLINIQVKHFLNLEILVQEVMLLS